MDSRFHLKLNFHIYGKDFPWDCSLNWFAEPGEIDRRITEFFLESHDEAKRAFDEKCLADQADRLAEEREDREREQLRVLKEKYPDV